MEGVAIDVGAEVGEEVVGGNALVAAPRVGSVVFGVKVKVDVL